MSAVAPNMTPRQIECASANSLSGRRISDFDLTIILELSQYVIPMFGQETTLKAETI